MTGTSRGAPWLLATLVGVVASLNGFSHPDPWPDLSYAPRPGPGRNLEGLAELWTPVGRSLLSKDGVEFRVPREARRELPRSGRVLVYYRGEVQGQLVQGLAGHAEILGVDFDTKELRLAPTLAHAQTIFLHDPWTGWKRGVGYRPGYDPGSMSYFLSTRNLTAMDSGVLAQVLAGKVYRGMASRDALRAWGAPAARSGYDFDRGRQEQWVYQLDPQRRRYLYLDTSTQRVTAWHEDP